MSTTVLNTSTHTKYFLRCLKTLLPTAYTPNDSQRMTLGFFILTALDLLGALVPNTSESDRNDLINWIYQCQLPDGGFRGFTGADFGKGRTQDNECWDPANLAATYFALGSLAILGDDFLRLRRRECLRWLKSLQYGDGTFGEALGMGGRIEGGRDVRYCYCAAAVRWMLHGGSIADEEDIDVKGLLRFVRSLQVCSIATLGTPKIKIRKQTFEGGFASAPFHEAHGTPSVATAAG